MKHLLPTLLLAASLLTAAGCKVTVEDVQHWERTVKGPGKIVRVLLSTHYDLGLRTEAAMALVRMQRTDTDGIQELGQALRALKDADPEGLTEVVNNMVPQLESMMNGGNETQADQSSGPPPEQVRAKDAAFVLVRFAEGQNQQRLVVSLVDWFRRDYTGRSLAGNFSAEQVIREIGSPAASRMVEAIEPTLPRGALIKICQLIGEIGDDATKTRAGERLVAMETRMETQAYIDELKPRVSAQLAAQNEGQAPSDARVLQVALFNRTKDINEGVLPAMKHLNSVPAVASRLVAIASAAPPEGTPAVAAAELNARRGVALTALEGGAQAAPAQQLLQIALNAANPAELRDVAFDRIAETGNREAIEPMWALVSASGADRSLSAAEATMRRRLRWRAGELVLSLGGADVVPQLFDHLPAGATEAYLPEELEGYATRISQLSGAPTDLMRQQLSAPQWWRRVIAMHYLQRKGVQADVARLERLGRDRAALVGDDWPAEVGTVGKLSEAALAALRQRLSGGSSGS